MFRGSMHAGMAANAEAKEPGAAPIPSPASASPPASETKWPPETAKQEHCQQEILESNLGKPLCAPAVPGVLGAGALNATDPSRPTDDQEGICFPAGPPPGDAKNSTTSEQPVAQPEPEGQLARPQEELEATDLQIQGHAGDEPQTRGGLQETVSAGTHVCFPAMRQSVCGLFWRLIE